MKRLSVGLALAMVLVLAASPCARADHVFFAFLDGSQETPPVGTSAFGIGIFVLSDDLTVLNWAVSYGGLEGGTVTGAHFHQAPFGTAGGVIRGYNAADFSSPDGYIINSWSADDQQALTEARVAALFEGNIYFNIHTQSSPGGEIRGQLGYFFSY